MTGNLCTSTVGFMNSLLCAHFTHFVQSMHKNILVHNNHIINEYMNR
jgi:hypothetical protein